MKDIQKIKEFFSKPLEESLTGGYPHTKTSGENFEKITITEPIDDATKNKMIKNFRAAGWDAKPNNGGGITAIKKSIMEGNKEYFKPSIRKDKSNPNFLYVDITYPEGSDVLSVGGSKTMGGQDREEGAAKAMSMGNAIVKKLEAKYNIEDIEVKDLKNGKIEVFAVSDDFIKMASPSLDEAKKETAVDMAKKQLDALGVKYELGNEFKPFKVIYKPINKSDEFYDKFEDIVDLFNLKSVVKSSMSEAKEKYSVKPNKKGFSVIKTSTGSEITSFDNEEKAKQHAEKLNKMKFIPKEKFNEAQEEDVVDTITMDVPLFIRMLEYSREDAAEDMDLHDVTEKAISLGKERGILQMDDYDEIVGTTEKVNEVNLKQSKLSSAEYQKAKKLKDFKSSDWKWNADEDLYTKVNEATDYMKRRKAQDDYAVSKKDKPKKSSNPTPSGKTDYMKSREKGLEERINETLNQINEELCPAGKAYIKRRQAAGEKSSAYLSGRGVKVCKGQMSGKAKKKK
jgi:hypothetical protein